MKHIEINIGKACNNKCRFCMSAFVGENEKELTDFNLVKKEIETYSNNGYKSIGFLGGDISIHPKIHDIIQVAKINGFEKINIITNGMLFNDFEKAKNLIELGTTRVNISIHSHKSSLEDYLTQVLGGFEKKLKAIDNFNLLYNNGLLISPLSINIVLNGLNYMEILKTCVFFYKKKNIKDIRINFLWNRDFYTKEDKEELEIGYGEILIVLKKLIIFSLKTDLRITFEGIPACIFNKLEFPSLNIILKTFLGEDYDYIEEISNINQNITFNWKTQKRDKLKTKFDKCDKCLYFNKCQGVWKEYVKKYGKKEFIIVN